MMAAANIVLDRVRSPVTRAGTILAISVAIAALSFLWGLGEALALVMLGAGV